MPFVPLLLPLVYVFGGLIFCYLVVYIAEAFFNASANSFGWIPYVNGLVKRSTLSIQQKITNVIGQAASSYDKTVGGALHHAAEFVNQIGRFLQAQAQVVTLLAQAVTAALTPSVSRADLKKLGQQISAAQHRITGIGNDVLPRVKGLERGIGEDVLPKLRAEEKQLGKVVSRDLPAINARLKAHEKGIGHVWDWVKGHVVAAGSIAFAGATAIALARMGASWVRCSNVGKVGRALCRTPLSQIEGLLGLLTDFLVLENICTILPLLEEAASVVALPIVDTLTAAGAGLCRTSSGPPATLNVPTLHLPAAVSLELHLP